MVNIFFPELFQSLTGRLKTPYCDDGLVAYDLVSIPHR